MFNFDYLILWLLQAGAVVTISGVITCGLTGVAIIVSISIRLISWMWTGK